MANILVLLEPHSSSLPHTVSVLSQTAIHKKFYSICSKGKENFVSAETLFRFLPKGLQCQQRGVEGSGLNSIFHQRYVMITGGDSLYSEGSQCP